MGTEAPYIYVSVSEAKALTINLEFPLGSWLKYFFEITLILVNDLKWCPDNHIEGSLFHVRTAW